MNNQMMCTEALINQQEEFKNDRTLFQQYWFWEVHFSISFAIEILKGISTSRTILISGY